MQLPRRLPISPIRRNKRRQADGATIRKQLRHFGDPPYILAAVRGRKPQVLVQSEADVVAVEEVGLVSEVQEVLLQGDRYGGFS